MMQFVIVFFCMFSLDFLWPFYMRACERSAPARAGLWALALLVASSMTTISYTRDPWMVIPAGLGAFCGTWLSLLWKKRA